MDQSRTRAEGSTMSTSKTSFRDFAHPTLEPILKQHNALSLKLLLTVADFAQKVASAHEAFSAQLLSVVSQFRRISLELMKERPVEYHSSVHLTWDTLLHETELDAQSQADTATQLIKNVYDPLVEVVQHKKSHQKKLYGFREQFEAELDKSSEILNKRHDDYVDCYHRYHMNSRDQTRNLTSYFDAHNEYVLQLWASNRMQDEFHTNALPFILEELEEIHIDTSNVLNGAMESHSLLLVTKATEQTHRFEEILKVCKQVNPKGDVMNFVRAVNPDMDMAGMPANIFRCPEEEGNGEGILKNEIITDRLTENMLKQKRLDLQKEAAELTSYIQQNQDVTQTLINICQRNLANHLYSKVYETQEDLCRKRNEIRMAKIQLAAIREQIDLLTPKQNGTMEQERDKKSAQSIKGMWKKAFRSLKQSKTKSGEAGSTKPASGGRRSFLKRKDSRDAPVDEVMADPSEIDPVYSLLKCAAEIPKSGKHCHTAQCGLTGPKLLLREASLAASMTNENLQIRSTGSSRSSSPNSNQPRRVSAGPELQSRKEFIPVPAMEMRRVSAPTFADLRKECTCGVPFLGYGRRDSLILEPRRDTAYGLDSRRSSMSSAYFLPRRESLSAFAALPRRESTGSNASIRRESNLANLLTRKESKEIPSISITTSSVESLAARRASLVHDMKRDDA